MAPSRKIRNKWKAAVGRESLVLNVTGSYIPRDLLLIDHMYTHTHTHIHLIIKSCKFNPLIKQAWGLMTMNHNNVVFLNEIESLNHYTSQILNDECDFGTNFCSLAALFML